MVGMVVNPDGSVEVTEGTEADRVLMGPIAERLREVVALASLLAEENRTTNPTLGRNAALVRTHAQQALLFALFGDLV